MRRHGPSAQFPDRLFPCLGIVLRTGRRRGFQHDAGCLRLVAASVLASWFATEIVTLLFGSAFTDSAAVLQVLVWGLPFACLRVIAREALRAEGQERIETLLMVAIAALHAAACYLLIPAFGIMACAWTAVTTELLLAVSYVTVLAGRRDER